MSLRTRAEQPCDEKSAKACDDEEIVSSARILLPSLLALLVAACAGASSADEPPPAPPTPEVDAGALPDAALPSPDAADAAPPPVPRNILAVNGNRFVDGDDKDVRLLGVNYSGAEYMCIQARGIYDGPVDDALVGAIASWKANLVRVAVNPHCWLGLSAVDARYAGKVYRDAIIAFVERIRMRGMYVALEVHWSSSIEGQATQQQPMLDRVTGLPFWKSVAQTFAADRGVAFDVFNEPFLNVTNTNHAFSDDVWECWRLGCQVTGNGESFVAAGMQPLVDEIRGTGAKNVILLGGLDYANDFRGMLTHLPTDPAKAIAASAHVYPTNRCKDTTCWTNELAPVAMTIPLITGELGQHDCMRSFVEGYMAWADPRGIGYLGWTFNVADCATRPSLITDYAGTPSVFGAAFKDRFATLGK
jgi:endoglucanase